MRLALLFIVAAVVLAGGDPPAHSQQQSPSQNDIFSSPSIFEATLEAPLQELFGRGRRDQEFSVKGKLTFMEPGGRKVAVEGIDVALRGHTSLQETECEFPKLKLTLPQNRPPSSARCRHAQAGHTLRGEARRRAHTEVRTLGKRKIAASGSRRVSSPGRDWRAYAPCARRPPHLHVHAIAATSRLWYGTPYSWKTTTAF